MNYNDGWLAINATLNDTPIDEVMRVYVHHEATTTPTYYEFTITFINACKDRSIEIKEQVYNTFRSVTYKLK